ncbi:MAG: ribbon-helix-helix protein, CopG family [Clostridiales bacterium]|nr:ribbon-helix-helix protein, CopG family [Clostridiales bacterium]
MKPLKEKISITIDADLLNELKEEAEKDERSLSQFINLILRKYIKEIKVT